MIYTLRIFSDRIKGLIKIFNVTVNQYLKCTGINSERIIRSYTRHTELILKIYFVMVTDSKQSLKNIRQENH